MHRVRYRAEILPKGNGYVGRCPELKLSRVGTGPEEALYSLQEAVEALVDECESAGTLDQVMVEAGFVQSDGTWISL